MQGKIFNMIFIAVIIILIPVFIYASFTTWDGYFLHPDCDFFSTKTKYIEIYHGWDEYERYNVSYNPSCYMSISSISNDGFLVGNHIDIDIYGFVEFDEDVVGNIKNVNVTILFNPPIIDTDGNSIFMTQSLTTIHNYKRWFEFSCLITDIHYNVSGSKRIGARAQISDENGSYNISFDYENFIDVEPAYLTTQLKLTKAVVILAYWTVFFSIVMAFDKIKNLFKEIKKSNSIKENGEIHGDVGPIHGSKNMTRLGKLMLGIKSKNFFQILRNGFAIFFCLILILIFLLNSYGVKPNTFFTSLILTFLSLAIACHAVVIAMDSDEKMKSIATGDFFEITYRFWDRAPILYRKQSKGVRDTQSWQLGNLFRHGDKLKKWADPDVQEKLIKEFKTFLERLRPTKCEKYWVEVKNYMGICNIAIGFKTKNDCYKEKLIDEIGNWIGKKEHGESNKNYLKRKSEEFAEKKKYDIFKG